MAEKAEGAISKLLKGLRLLATGVEAPLPEVEQALADLRARLPAPIFWLVGKTQSGKTSIIRFLTGADDAAIGNGFRPCTRTTRLYHFPTAEAPLLTFRDTRGLDEPGYDPSADVADFASQSHAIIATVKISDFAQGNLRNLLQGLRREAPGRPVILALTCLHEAYPQKPHPLPYPFLDGIDRPLAAPYDDLGRMLSEHGRAFAGLYDACVPIDFTPPAEGFEDPFYGGEALKAALLKLLPEAYRQTLTHLSDATQRLKEVHQQAAAPLIVAYSTLAASAGAIPVPLLDLPLVTAIQVRMALQIARVYHQPFSPARLWELAATLGLGLAVRQAARQAAKFVPGLGSAVGAASAWAATYALGRTLCAYYQEACAGHLPNPQQLKTLYDQQLRQAEEYWRLTHPTPAAISPSAPRADAPSASVTNSSPARPMDAAPGGQS